MKHYKILILLSLLFSGSLLQAKVDPPGSDTARGSQSVVRDSPIVAMLDSLANVKFYKSFSYSPDVFILNKYKYPLDFVPTFSDSVYSLRLARLDMDSPFDLVFNEDVKEFIDLYAVRKRGLTQRILGLTHLYFPLFEEVLDRFNLPLELKYLAIIESALNPVAKSRAGACGLWQFIIGTGKLYNLHISSFVDDRRDPYKATIAACEHLSDLYEIYHDWSLVLAAYNSGAGNVNKAIRRSGGKMNFWEIKRFLPKETRGYVPAFIAVNYVMRYATEHNLYPQMPKMTAYEVDTVTVKQKLSLTQVSEFFKIPYEDVEFLNPAYKKDIIPASDEEYFVLRLPKMKIGEFIYNETALYNYRTQEELQREEAMRSGNLAKENASPGILHVLKTHVVRKGETLKTLARKYDCTSEEIRDWNKLKSGSILPKQRLIVLAYYQKPRPENLAKQEPPKDTTTVVAETKPVVAKAERQNNSPEFQKEKYIYHVVQKGDTLWEIANKYKGVSVEQLKALNNIRDSKSIKPGQKIKVAVAG